MLERMHSNESHVWVESQANDTECNNTGKCAMSECWFKDACHWIYEENDHKNTYDLDGSIK